MKTDHIVEALTGDSGWKDMIPQVDSSDFPTQWVPSAYKCSIIDAQAKEIEKLRGQLRHLCRNCDLDRLEKLAEADRDGRVVVLPCQSGEHVFALLDDQTHVWECEVEHAVLDGWRKVFAIRPLGRSKDSYYAPFGAFGQTVFLTREEAEKALEAMKDGN